MLTETLGEGFVQAYSAVRQQGFEAFNEVVSGYEFDLFSEMY